jgi:hypothetical protein
MTQKCVLTWKNDVQTKLSDAWKALYAYAVRIIMPITLFNSILHTEEESVPFLSREQSIVYGEACPRGELVLETQEWTFVEVCILFYSQSII